MVTGVFSEELEVWLPDVFEAVFEAVFDDVWFDEDELDVLFVLELLPHPANNDVLSTTVAAVAIQYF